jgi:hypothetical protein
MTLRAASDNQSPEAFHRKARARRKSACAAVKGGGGRLGTVISAGMATMNTVRSMFAGAALLALPAEAQEHRFEDDPVVMVRENFVACDVLSQLQRVMDNPRFLLSGECDPVRAGDRVRVYARRGPYVCIYPHDTVSPCKWTHEKALAK